jgi:hypothetical protein
MAAGVEMTNAHGQAIRSKHSEGSHQHGARGVPAAEAVDEAGGRCLRGLGFLDHVDDVGKRVVSRCLCDSDPQLAMDVDAARIHGGA